MNLRNPNRGFSLVEMVIAMALFVFLFGAGFMVVKSLFQSSNSSLMQARANEKLKTVSAMIQNEAVSTFDTLEETDRDRTGFLDPQIKILSTIGPINPTDRTRLVTLVATYPTSPTNTSTVRTQFILSNTLTGINGANVRVKVVSSLTGNPVKDVLVSAPSQGTGEVQGYTTSNGECVLFNVLEGSPTAKLTLNGQGIYAHFVPNPPSFRKDVNMFNMTPGMHDLGVHPIILPGGLQVRVLDVSNDTPVEDYEVRVYPRPGYVPTGTCTTNASCWLGGGFLNGLPAITNADGLATFNNLLPGQYYLVGMGGAKWAAWDKCLTSPGNNTSRDPHIVVQSEQTNSTPQLAYTIEKGSMKLQFFDAIYKSGEYIYQDPVAAGCTVTFAINDDFSDHYDFSGNRITGYYWGASLVRSNLTIGYSYYLGETLDEGKMYLNDIGPRIINSSATLPSASGAERQAVTVTPMPGALSTPLNLFTTPDPYLPVIVKYHNDDPSDPRLLIASNAYLRKTFPATTPLTEFNHVLFTNGLTGSADIGASGLLVKSPNILARAQGDIVPNGTNQFLTDNFNYSTVRTMWGPTAGTGGVKYDPVSNANYIDPGHWVSLSVVGSGPTQYHHFDISNLLPFGPQGFLFQAQPATLIDYNNTQFHIPVIVWTKNAAGEYVQEASPNSSPTITLRFKYMSGGGLNTAVEAPDQVGVQIINGVISFNNRTTYGSDSYQATIPPLDLIAGGTTMFPPTNLLRTATRRSYLISMVEDTSNQFDFVAPPIFTDWGWGHSYKTATNRYEPDGAGNTLQLARRAITSLTVRVEDIGHNPIDGATVVLSGHGMTQMLQTSGSYGAGTCRFPNATPGTTFSFSYRPVPAGQSNLNVFVTAPAYQNSGTLWVPTGNPPATSFTVTMNQSAGSGGSN